MIRPARLVPARFKLERRKALKTRIMFTAGLLLMLALSQPLSQTVAGQQLRPDLVVRNIESIEDYKVVAVVSNFGKANSGSCFLRLEIIDDAHPKTVLKTLFTSVPSLQPAKFFVATFDTSPQKARGNRIQLLVDSSNGVQESNEYNNRLVDKSTVNKSDTDEAQLPSGTNLRPDLAIIRVAGAPGNKKAIRVRVANLGNAASLPCTLTLEIFESNDFNNRVEIMDKGVPALEPRHGEWILIEVETEFELSNAKNRITALRPFRLTVDSKNENPESNEKNNRMQFHVAP